MGALNWCLFFVCICFKVFQTEASSWTLTVPSKIEGLLGSCVVIPCTYNYPDPSKTPTKFTGIWKCKDNKVIYHTDARNIAKEYEGRTQLVGDLSQKNCSLQIDNLQQNDNGPYHFRIEMEGYEKYSYSQNEVSITITSDLYPTVSVKEEVLEGENVSATCSVSHSCPPSPPDFTWNHSGDKDLQSQQLSDGQWKATSNLTFQAAKDDHDKPLRCTVSKGGQRWEKDSSVLKVKFAPEIKATNSCSSEGDMVKCVCIVESRPSSSVYFVLSDRVLPSTKTDTHGYVTIGSLQAESGSSEFVQCLANNTVGSTNLTVPLSVSGKMQNVYIFIAIGAAGLLVTLVITVGVVKKCRESSGDTTTSERSSTKAEETVNVPKYATTKSRGRPEESHMSNMRAAKKAVELPQHATTKSSQMDNWANIYSNDSLYGNMETVCDDAIYTNMPHH
ncbi:hypothetical protein Q5P01_011063 [Channa striata]|uniref:Ig-like domain-containing protein n=1 Tax=Channa striata TaxID=64152 RepID=A0AA88MU28_CHASR|nr:hypothetical protein Q5P01_011063 [Channa striata]